VAKPEARAEHPSAGIPEPVRARSAPSPRAGLLGHLGAIRRDPIGFFLEAHRRYGDVVGLRLFLARGFFLAHPEHVKHVLQDHHTQYDKQTVDFRMLRPVLGNGLLTSDGATWLRQRRLMQPAFHRRQILSLGAVMVAEAEATAQRWAEAARTQAPVDVAADMGRLALAVVTQALFGTQVDAQAERVGQAVTTLNEQFADQLGSLRMLLTLLTGRPSRSMRPPLRTLDDTVQRIIAARRAEPAQERSDLLALLLAARDEETGAPMSDRELRDQVLTLFVAGHETTATALAWTWHLLATHPSVAAKLRAELASVLAGRAPTVEDLPQLVYTRMVIDETLRLYPPAWATSRNPVVDDEIGGFRIPAGSLVLLSPYVTHRHPEFWDRPEAFDPERFAPGRAATRHRFAYFPFGGGPHLCIGETFALTEATLVLATLAQRCRLASVPGHVVEPAPMVTLRPRGGLPMTPAYL
jgi:cytochrome P450